jgi:hypothetical protein
MGRDDGSRSVRLGPLENFHVDGYISSLSIVTTAVVIPRSSRGRAESRRMPTLRDYQYRPISAGSRFAPRFRWDRQPGSDKRMSTERGNHGDLGSSTVECRRSTHVEQFRAPKAVQGRTTVVSNRSAISSSRSVPAGRANGRLGPCPTRSPGRSPPERPGTFWKSTAAHRSGA